MRMSILSKLSLHKVFPHQDLDAKPDCGMDNDLKLPASVFVLTYSHVLPREDTCGIRLNQAGSTTFVPVENWRRA